MKTINLIPAQIEILKSCKEEQEIAELGFQTACKYLKLVHDRTWKKIKSLFPEFEIISINWEKWSLNVKEK